MTNAIERFWSKVSICDNGCWVWTRGTNGKGYGQFWNGEKAVPAHRFSFEMFNGKIPEGLEPDHLCRNRLCVNPDHIELVTGSENTRRGIGPSMARRRQLAKTHCPHGHPYDEQNTYHVPTGGRGCKTCRKQYSKPGRMSGNHSVKRC